MATNRANRRHLKTVGHRVLRLNDSAASWALYLQIDEDFAQLVKQALTRIVLLTAGKKDDADDVLRRALKRLLDATQGESIYFLCLAVAEHRGLLFQNLDDVFEVFEWLQERLDTWMRAQQGAPESRRVKRDDNYWILFVKLCGCLFHYFHGHQLCAQQTPPSVQTLIAAFGLAGDFNHLVPLCTLVRVLRSGEIAGIGHDLTKALVLAHPPVRLHDFAALMDEGLLTPSTYWEIASRPELVCALSYEGLKLLLTRWKTQEGTEFLAFARTLVDELYPQGVPTGTNPVWQSTPTDLVTFLGNWVEPIPPERTIEFDSHDPSPGLYRPLDARILLPPGIETTATIAADVSARAS